jgi:cytochrome c553
MRVRRVIFSAGWVTVIAALAVQAQAPGIRPVASIRQLHDALLTPASDALYAVGSEAPKTDAAWKAVRNQAVVLAEAGNLLMLPGRAKDGGEWMRLSTAMADAAARALRAAEKQDVDEVLKAGDEIAAICEACHEPYRDGRKMGPPPSPK